MHVKNCYPVLLSSIICASATKSSLVAIILCASICSTGFYSSRRVPIKVLLERLIIKNPFFQTSIKKAVLYVVQCVFLKIKFCFQMCYSTDFADMKHTLYNFLKRTKLSFLYFSKKYHFMKVNSFNLFLLSNQKRPLYHHIFQRAILAKFLVQFNSICILWCHCLHIVSQNFLAAILSLLWSVCRG